MKAKKRRKRRPVGLGKMSCYMGGMLDTSGAPPDWPEGGDLYHEVHVIKEHFDGAKKVVYPHVNITSISERVEYVAYDDCEFCYGSGVRIEIEGRDDKKIVRHHQCEHCADRFKDHPLRRAKDRAMSEYIPSSEQVREVYEKKIEGIEDEEQQEIIAYNITRWYHRDKKEVVRVINRRFERAKKMVVDEGIDYIEKSLDEIKKADLNLDYW